jgi:hypothetical protein
LPLLFEFVSFRSWHANGQTKIFRAPYTSSLETFSIDLLLLGEESCQSLVIEDILKIHANPVKARLVASAKGYRWSSFRAFYLGSAEPLPVDRELVVG